MTNKEKLLAIYKSITKEQNSLSATKTLSNDIRIYIDEEDFNEKTNAEEMYISYTYRNVKVTLYGNNEEEFTPFIDEILEYHVSEYQRGYNDAKSGKLYAE